MVDLKRVGEGAFKKIEKVFPSVGEDKFVRTYKRMTTDDFEVLAQARGMDTVTNFILDMEKRSLGGKNNGY